MSDFWNFFFDAENVFRPEVSSTLQFAEGMNLALFVVLSFATVMFTAFFINIVRRYGWRDERASASIGIDLLVVGEAILRGWYWWWRVQVNDGVDVSWMDAWPVPQIGMGLEMLGVLFLLRTFQPIGWRPHTWLWVGLSSIAVAAIVTSLPR